MGERRITVKNIKLTAITFLFLFLCSLPSGIEAGMYPEDGKGPDITKDMQQYFKSLYKAASILYDVFKDLPSTNDHSLDTSITPSQDNTDVNLNTEYGHSKDYAPRMEVDDEYVH